MTRLAASLVAIAAGLSAASPAYAADVRFEGPALVFEAAAGEANDVTVSRVSAPEARPTTYSFADRGAIVTAGDGCTQSDAGVTCYGQPWTVELRLGDRDDRVSLDSSPLIPNVKVLAGDGNDEIAAPTVIYQRVQFYGEEGNDRLLGGSGRDELWGGPGIDRLEGGAQVDTLYGDEIFSGPGGDDALVGGPGDDELHGGAGDDTLAGGSGDDGLDGGQGADTLTGQAGEDDLEGADGPPDRLFGGPGNDTLAGGPGADQIFGGRGTDTAYYGSSRFYYELQVRPGVTVFLDGRAPDGGPGERDRLAGDIENATGGGSGDTLKGGNGRNTLSGGAGPDRLVGGLGPDTLIGGEGTDLIRSRDDKRDLVACGAGPRDTALADTRDDVSAECELIRVRALPSS